MVSFIGHFSVLLCLGMPIRVTATHFERRIATTHSDATPLHCRATTSDSGSTATNWGDDGGGAPRFVIRDELIAALPSVRSGLRGSFQKTQSGDGLTRNSKVRERRWMESMTRQSRHILFTATWYAFLPSFLPSIY